MNRSVHKLLSIMLIFMLGLSPLQSVFADLSVPVDQNNMPCHQSVNPADEAQALHQSNGDCAMCVKATDCSSTCNSVGHCASTTMAGLLQNLLSITHLTSSLAILQTDENILLQQPPALFRPPRV